MKVPSLSLRRLSVLVLLIGACLCAPDSLRAQIGGLDPGFAPGAILNGAEPGMVRAQLVQSDGKVIIAGDFTSVGGVARGRIARLNLDGSLDAGYAAGVGADAPINALTFETGGRVLVGGEFQNVDGVARGRVARLTSEGALDTTFAAGAGANGAVHAILFVSPSVYIGGEFTQVHGAGRGRLARLSSTGSVEAWSTGTGANATVHALGYDSWNSRILLGGEFTAFNGQARNRLAALSTFSSGALGAFNASGGPDGTVRTMALPANTSSTFSLFIGGDFLSFGSTPRGRAAALTVSSIGSTSVTVDPGFSIWFDAPVRRIAFETPGSSFSRLLVGGDFTLVDGQPRNRLARLAPTSITNSITYWDLDVTFNAPAGASGPVRAISAMSDGKVMVGGEFSAIAGTPTQSVARLYSDAGSQPPAAPGGVTATAASATQIIVMFDSVSFATGYQVERSADGATGWSLVATQTATRFFDNNLAPNATWFYRIKATNSNGDSALSAVVSATTPASVWTGAGTLDPAATGVGAGGTVNAVVVQGDGCTLLAGSFSSVHGVPRKNIARLLPDWTVDPSFDPGAGPDSTVNDIALQPDGRIVIAGAFTNVAGIARKYVARLEADGALDLTFVNPGSGPSSSVSLVALQPSGHVLIAGFFTSVNGMLPGKLARLHPNGAFDSTFVNPLGDYPDSLSVQRDGRIIVSGFFVFGGSKYVLRLLPDGEIDSSFDIGSIGAFVESAVALNNGKVLVCGSFTTVNGVTRNRVARLNGDGSVDTSFHPGTGPDATVTRVVPQPDGKVVIVGSFTKVAGVLRPHIARLHADGTLDMTFQPGAGTFETINAVAVAPDTRIVVGGSFTSFGTGTPARIARLVGDGWAEPPPAPAGLAAVPVSSSRLLLTWSDLPAEQGWKLERSPNGTTGWSVVARLPWDVTSFADTGLAPATTYHYRLAATHGAGDSAFGAGASAATFTLFDQWKLDYSLSLAATDDSDDDGDNVGLLVEYGLGLDPTKASIEGVPVGQVLGDVMALSYRKFRSDVIYLVESSTDLDEWSTVGVNQGSGPFPIAWKFSAGLPQLYLRLRVSRP